MAAPSDQSKGKARETRLLHSGRSDPRVVSSPVYHASTVLFRDYAEFEARKAAPLDREHLYYGRMGLPTPRALEDALMVLDDSVGAVLAPSGVASIAAILSAFLSTASTARRGISARAPWRSGASARRSTILWWGMASTRCCGTTRA